MYRASTILRSSGITDAEACEATGLEQLDSIPIRPAPAWLRSMWRGPVAATTLPWAIYVDATHLNAPDLEKLVLHELVHVRQWQRHGVSRFLRLYIADYLRGRRSGLDHHHAYLAIRFEREARIAVAKHLAKPPMPRPS